MFLVRYCVTIDAGSSGSRVHVHHYYYDSHNTLQFNTNSINTKVKPGLSAFIHTPKQAANSILPLLEFATQHVPQPMWKHTPVYIKATAGLRAVDHTLAENVLQECRNLLKQYPFIFNQQHVKIIPGTYEGIYGWVATNYLAGTFNPKSDNPPVGVIEMGGASVQVSFVPKNLDGVDKSHLEIVKIGDKEFSLYTHSFLNYGLESAQSLFIEKLQSSGSAFEKPQNPCYPAGVEYQGTVGTGNYDSCFALLDKIFDKKACQVKSCSFNGVYQPKVTNEQFYAIENFFYTPEFFETLKSDTPISALLEKGKKFCKNSWIDVVKTYASEKEPEDQLKKYCFSSAYIPKILSEGFGIANPDKSIKVAKKIKDSSIDWSLGSVIHDVVNNPALLPSKSNEEDVRIHSVNAGYSLESVILLLIFSVIGVVFFQRFMSKRNGPGRSNSKIISLSRVSLSNS